MTQKLRPLMLIVLDGWGAREESHGNAIALARTPNWTRLLRDFPNNLIDTSGESVGLPAGQMGNSEVGHLNLGAGRIVYQELTRIDRSIRQGDFYENEVLAGACRSARERGGTLHLLGLCSDGCVHSSLDHLYALLDLAKRQGVERVAIHAFLDGRDTAPTSGAGYVEAVERKAAELGVGRVATVCGRYYAMDRDKRWDRIERAYRLLVDGVGEAHPNGAAAVAAAYEAGETDEFVTPRKVEGVDGRLGDGDAVIFFNFRADRARQLSRALTAPEFDGFARGRLPNLGAFTCMTQYEDDLGLPVAYRPQVHHGLLCDVLGEIAAPQLRIAETEKYAHVTYFFNGGEEEPKPGEERILVPSPRDVATYDLKPQMSAPEVTNRVVEAIDSRRFSFILLNFANADMVGHTGVMPAAIAAVETLDECLGRITAQVRAVGGAVLITADHGNIEQMIDPATGGPHTAHTTNPVPLILVDEERRGCALARGIPADVAPTLLSMWGLALPEEMEGHSLL